MTIRKLCKQKTTEIATPDIFCQIINFAQYKKEDLLNDDFLQLFKSRDSLNSFLAIATTWYGEDARRKDEWVSWLC